jgi:hypothetical protein
MSSSIFVPLRRTRGKAIGMAKAAHESGDRPFEKLTFERVGEDVGERK